MGDYSDTFGTALLGSLGAPITGDNLVFLKAWATAEGGTARWNPFNTELHMTGSTNYNPQGVQDYPSFGTGLTATRLTLTNGNYRPILAGLHLGNDAMACAQAVAATPWGTGEGVIGVLKLQGYKPSQNGTDPVALDSEDLQTITDIVHQQVLNVLRSDEVAQILKRAALGAIAQSKP